MDSTEHSPGSNWFVLAIGNSRLHWAWMLDSMLQHTWDTPHASAELVDRLGVEQAIADLAVSTAVGLTNASPDLDLSNALALFQSREPPPLWIASVVPQQTAVWQRYRRSQLLTLTDIPLQNLYPTLGIDRALSLWGAVATLGTPALVLDAGTALTLTGLDAALQLRGGAILPGLRLQYQALAHDTAALPTVALPLALPPRWATNTAEAIHSGILYTVLAGIEAAIADWLVDFPGSAIAFTGGDSPRLYSYLAQSNSTLAAHIVVDQQLLFRGVLNSHVWVPSG